MQRQRLLEFPENTRPAAIGAADVLRLEVRAVIPDVRPVLIADPVPVVVGDEPVQFGGLVAAADARVGTDADEPAVEAVLGARPLPLRFALRRGLLCPG